MENCEEGIPSTAIREIALVKECKHPNIVGLKEIIHTDDKLWLVFEYCDYDLKKYMNKFHILSPKLIKSFCHQMLLGVDYCHAHRIMHRDLKPMNLLIDNNNRMKLADFGLARAFGLPIKTLTHEVITLWYRPPEILMGQKEYSLSVDIWSAGCIFYEMITGRPLFEGESEISQLYKIFQIMGTPTEINWPGVTKLKDYKSTFPKYNARRLSDLIPPNFGTLGIDLFSRMIVLDPRKRISAKDALKHVFLNSLILTMWTNRFIKENYLIAYLLLTCRYLVICFCSMN